MKRRRVVSAVILSWFCLGLMNAPVSAQDAVKPQFVIIGHAGVSETLTHDEIKQIFLGRMTRKNGNSLGFIILKDKTVYAAFLKASVGKTIAQYTNYWKKQVFTGKGRMPKMFDDPADAQAYVAETEGAISFLPSTLDVDDAVHTITITE